MSQQTLEHPSQEALAELALDAQENDVAQHVEACPDCLRIVEEIRSLKDAIIALPDEEVPEHVRKSILQRQKEKKFSLFGGLAPASNLWLNNPVVLSIGFVLFLIFLYYFIVFICK